MNRQPIVVSKISALRENAVSAFGMTSGARDMLSTPPAIIKLLRATKVKEGTVFLTGGLALDTGLLAALQEILTAQNLPIEARSNPDSIYAGAIGAAIWGAFRHDKLVRLNKLAA